MKKLGLFLFGLVSYTSSYAQSDTIYVNNEKIVASIKEVTQDAIQFTYPNEDLINTIYKNTVQKIVFKSGRTQVFAEQTSFKKVNSANDWENVSISQVENEVKGLFKVGDVSSKAKGATIYSNTDRIKDRAFRKLKMQAAMSGGNVVYMTQLNASSAQYTVWGSKAAEAILSGVAYTNTLPSFESFKKKIADKKSFKVFEQVKMWSTDAEFSKSSYSGDFVLSELTNDAGLINVSGTIPGVKDKKFRVTGFDDNSFTVMYESKSTLYNYRVAF